MSRPAAAALCGITSAIWYWLCIQLLPAPVEIHVAVFGIVLIVVGFVSGIMRR